MDQSHMNCWRVVCGVGVGRSEQGGRMEFFGRGGHAFLDCLRMGGGKKSMTRLFLGRKTKLRSPQEWVLAVEFLRIYWLLPAPPQASILKCDCPPWQSLFNEMLYTQRQGQSVALQNTSGNYACRVFGENLLKKSNQKRHDNLHDLQKPGCIRP